MTQNYSTHKPNTQSLASWTGIVPQKFNIGKFHHNHPNDQLDSLMVSNKPQKELTQGKKQFHSIKSKEPESKFHLRTYESKYSRSKVFDVENIKTLVKIQPKKDENMPLLTTKSQMKTITPYTIGTSKIKALEKGTKKTGIYRNFYKNQMKSQPFLLDTYNS